MTSSFTTRKRLEKQNPGENSNTWGGYLNTNTIDMIDECFGLVCVAMTTAGDSVLSTQNGATDQGRRSQIVLTGAPTSNVSLFAPAVQSFYLIRNKMTGANKVTLKNTGGTVGVDFSGSGSGLEQGLVVSDGTNVREVLRTVSIGAFNAFTSAVIAAVSNVATDATGGAGADFLPFIDASENGALNKVPVSTFFKNAVSDFPDEPSVAVSDGFVIFDQSTSTARTTTFNNAMKGLNVLTADSSPDHGADFFLSYDASAAAPKKVPGYAIGPALPGVSNLLIVNGGATTNVTITFDQAVLVNAAGQGLSVVSGNYTCDCSTNAAINRLDTGSLANNTEYHIWLIAKSDGTGAGSLMSLSATSPTLPTGYSGGFKYRIGCFMTGGAATFLRIRQIGNRAQYVVGAGTTVTAPISFSVSTNASKTALTAAGTTGAGGAQKVPSTARSILLSVGNSGATNSSTWVFPNNDVGYTATFSSGFAGSTGSGTAPVLYSCEIVLESTSIYYISGNNASGASASILCNGWVDRVNAT